MLLQSGSIYLRPLDLTDAPALQELRAASRDYHRPFEPLRPDDQFTLAFQEEQIRQNLLDSKHDKSYIFGIFLCEGDRLIGRISLTSVFRGPWQNANIGYYMDCRFAGKGYMTLAVKLAVQHALCGLKLHRVQGAVMPRNTPSIRVLEKAGFRYEGLARNYLHIHGVWEDHNIYAVTSEDLGYEPDDPL
ncbi:Putative ribosomal N-acetyltransferase YdaF [Paenibacillus konkukensis]|uniref:Ribosomal N-acetyltransferase YdaF n=1 Tax=Paenibacillus konkukensis TaxID=2020716 RepID=A0ABY4RRP4_9BACL|nr:GNAT family protein [Paenibacillus konkukensis]UQZ84848.1 Putative ribosomal N-acetyltransferase YdaF [Paenibacillus konkukensis]